MRRIQEVPAYYAVPQQKRELVAKDKKLDPQAKKTVKEWRREDLPTKASDHGGGGNLLWTLHVMAKDMFVRPLLDWADCLSGRDDWCLMDDNPCLPQCAISPQGGAGYRVLVERRLGAVGVGSMPRPGVDG
jgi:hypothetical protein